LFNKKNDSTVITALSLDRISYVGNDALIDLIDHATETKVGNFCAGSYVLCIALSRDKSSLLVGCYDSDARVMDIITGKIRHVCRGHTKAVSCIIAGSGSDVITCSDDMTIKRWTSEGVCVRTYLGHSYYVISILFSAKRNRIYSASYDKSIRAWDYDSGVELATMLGHENWVISLAWVQGEETFVSGSYDNSVRLWDATRMVLIKVIGTHASVVQSVAASPDGRFVVSGGDDNKVNIWDVETSQLVYSLTNNIHDVYQVTISPNGAFLGSGDCDGMFCIQKIDPPFSIIIHKGILSTYTHASKNFSLFSDGIIRDGDTLGIVVTLRESSTCTMLSDSSFTLASNINTPNNNRRSSREKRKIVREDEALEFTASTTESAQLWVESISAVIHNLRLDPLQQVVSAEKMIERYRYDLLQVIIQFTGPFELRFPKFLRGYIGNYLIHGKVMNNI
jgi:WD40 repeat protein